MDVPYLHPENLISISLIGTDPRQYIPPPLSLLMFDLVQKWYEQSWAVYACAVSAIASSCYFVDKYTNLGQPTLSELMEEIKVRRVWLV